MENGKELVIIVDGMEIGSCNPLTIDTEKEWRKKMEYAKEWTWQGSCELIDSDIYQYYHKRLNRFYFRNCYGDKLMIELSEDKITGELNYGELTKALIE